MKFLAIFLTLLTIALPALADPVDVKMVKATQTDDLWTFDVTVSHPDGGSDHLMNSIAIFTIDNVMLGETQVPMPHIGSKQITIQISDIHVPDDNDYVIIRAHCSADGWGDGGMLIMLE